MQNEGKILLVDDDTTLRWTLAEALRSWGYDVHEAPTANEALASFDAVAPRAVLLDIGLPDGSGLDLLREIKRRSPQTVVVIMTGEVVVENTISALRGDADDFVGKPIHLDEMQLALERALQKQPTPPPVAAPSTTLPRLLIITDSPPRADRLLMALRLNDLNVTTASTPDEWTRASESAHDLIVVDVEAAQWQSILAALRANPLHAEVPILVEISRLVHAPNLSGVLPYYRAMPCTPTELVALARRRLTSQEWAEKTRVELQQCLI